MAFPLKIFAQELPTIGANLNTYVPPAGSECDINVPSQYATIQAAVDAAVSGNTVCVGIGTYNENVTINKSITLAGRGASKSIINGQAQSYNIYGVSTVVILNASGNITVEGFRIIGAGTAPNDSSVLLLGSSSGAIIQYNHIISGNSGYAFYIQWIRSNDVIQNNILEGNNSNQVFTSNHNGPTENEQILNNTFTGTVLVNSSVSDSGVVFKFGGKNSIIKQNVFSTDGMVDELMQITYTPNIVTENNFSSPTDRKLRLSGGNLVPLNAENNWWGTTEPTATEYGSANIIGVVDYTPFALSPFPEYSLNQPPEVGTISAPTTPVQVNTSITATSNFTDQNTSDTHTASWNWGDGNTTIGTVTENNGSGSISDTHVYTAAGVYTITLTVTDNDGATGTSIFQYVSVYNPTPQGLFSGSRIFNDPATGAKAMFGVSVKYQGDTPAGNVRLSIKNLNFDFDAISISSLVTASGKATLRGSGTLNGASGYTFLTTGIDSSLTGGQTIRFQIKDSSNNVVYDAQPGAPDTADPTTSVTGHIIVH